MAARAVIRLNADAPDTVGDRVQRQPPQAPSVANEISDLKKRQAITEKKVNALALDAKWRGLFGAQIADYTTAINRVTKGLETAGNGFQQAQVDQALFEQLSTQIVGAALTVGFAIGFEWMFRTACGGVTLAATKMKTTIPILTDKAGAEAGSAVKALSEKVENPANTAAQAGVNLTAAGKAQGSQTSGQAPAEATAPGGAPVGSALGFLAGNTATLSDHVKGIEQAFAQRATNIGAAPDDFWDNYNPSTQEAIYQGLLDELKKSGKGAANLKDDAKLSEVLECHLWAAWIRRQTVPDIVHGATIKGLGSFIEDRMNVLNIGAKTPTAITMTGHWYSSNTPSNWRQILITWANSYAEPISTK